MSATGYVLAPPDVIHVASKHVREIHGHRETIRPDGRVTLPLLGSVFVAGRTCEHVSVELEALPLDYYKGADVKVRVAQFASKKVFVFGEVSVPGAYPYDGTNTVLKTIAKLLPTRLADLIQVQVLRPNHEGQLVPRMTIGLDQIILHGDTTLSAVLKEGKIVEEIGSEVNVNQTKDVPQATLSLAGNY